MVKFLSQRIAQQVDVDLMGRGKFSIDQLMELAGLSVAACVAHVYDKPNVLIVAGPGNNGGDGLVAARHLKHFGCKVAVHYPKRPQKDLYSRLVQQCQDVNVEFQNDSLDFKGYSVIIDAIFGFSFTGDIRSPFDKIIQEINASNLPIVSVDIPSGWDVEQGPRSGCIANPAVLISLTAPKLCAQHLCSTTQHFIGGRFVPDWMKQEYELDLPDYPGSQQFVQLSKI